VVVKVLEGKGNFGFNAPLYQRLHQKVLEPAVGAKKRRETILQN